jgi:hypothetical protein
MQAGDTVTKPALEVGYVEDATGVTSFVERWPGEPSATSVDWVTLEQEIKSDHLAKT